MIPPADVKPFVRRQKNDAADAEAICEAAVRPTMRFVAVKTEEQQARAMLFRTRDLLVRQRTQLVNALRGHLTEHGVVVPQGPANLKGLAEAIESEITPLPLLVVELSRVFLDQIDGLSKKIAELGLTFPVVLQKSWEISKLYGIFETPVGYLIDENGVIVKDVAKGAEAILALLSMPTPAMAALPIARAA